MSEVDVADHAFLGGRLLLREPKRGHRSGTDAALLSATARLRAGQHLIDVGSGAGAAALGALSHMQDATATLIEHNPQMAQLARHNIAVNGFGERAEVIEVDLFDVAACRASLPSQGDVVISNPPFYLEGTVRASPNRQQATSHVLAEFSHADWCRRVLGLAKPRGRIVLIHRPEALAALLSSVERRAGVIVRTIHPRPDAEASRILFEALEGRRSPLKIHPPLFLHEADGRFTPEADAVHHGLTML